MSAEVLRRAAALMREQFPGRCDCAGGLIETQAHEISCSFYGDEWPRAVANLLDDAADNADLAGDLAFDMRVHIASKYALDVARAYLGEVTR